VWHCPICDGWERRDQPLGVIGTGKSAEEMALKLTTWTRDLVVLTNGQGGALKRGQRMLLERNGVVVNDSRITSLDGEDGRLRAVRFEDGERLERKGLFFCGPERQRTDLARTLGCEFTRKGSVKTGNYETTGVPGLYVAGDADGLVRLAIVAAAEGALAGFAINSELTKEQLHR
jgi:thioredoxin reductase